MKLPEGSEPGWPAGPLESTPTTTWLRRSALLLIVALGVGLRLWGIDYGLPNTGSRPDEEQVIGAADAWLRDGEWPPRREIYPTLPMHTQAAVLWATSILGRALGVFADRDGFLACGPALSYRIGRRVSAAFGVATIVVTFALGRKLSGSNRVGLLSALTLATLYLHVRDSHFATVDATTAFFTTLTLLLSLLAAESDAVPPWLMAGVAAGLAAASKYNAVAVFAPVVVAAVFRARDGARTALMAGRLGASALAMAVAYECASPTTLVHWSQVIKDVAIMRQKLYGASNELALFVHLKETFPVGIGEVVCVAALLGIARGIRRRPVLLMLAFIVPTAASAASVRLVYPRYLVTLAPPLAVLAAEATLALIGTSWPSFAAATLALAAPGLARSVAYDRLASRPDTRLLIADWVNDRYHPATHVLLCHGWGRPMLSRRTRVMDCRDSKVASDWAHVMITPSHPFLGRWDPVSPELLGFLGQRATRVMDLDPFRPGSSANPYFYDADAFYLPFSGLSAVERGGPAFTVWELKPPPPRLKKRPS